VVYNVGVNSLQERININMKLYVAQQIKSQIISIDNTTSFITELIGVFDTKQKAENACTGEWDCIIPVNINEIAPRESVVHPEAYYPNDVRIINYSDITPESF